MEALKTPPLTQFESGVAAPRYIPALPSLDLGMLMPPRRASLPFPFNAPGVSYGYFARNAVWTLARVFELFRGEVLVPAYHHGVEVEALIDAGVTPRFYPVGPRMEVDPADVARRIQPKKTRALYLIHFLGFPGPVEAFQKLAEEHGLVLIEDCALALFSRRESQPLGSFGDASVFSLYKTLPLPNGGALVLNEGRPRGLPRLPEPPRLSMLSHLAASYLQGLEFRRGALGRTLRKMARGLSRRAVASTGIERVATGTQHFAREHARLGMSAISRRILAAQDVAGIVERRRRNFFFLQSRLRDLGPSLIPELPAGVCPLFFPLRVEDKTRIQRLLGLRGIETVDFWRYGHPACLPGEFPDVEKLRQSVLEIPIHQDLSPAQMSFVARAIHEVLPR
ncbi:MAG: DegT/DnrJ/EryC1/StrS family aminotransferase [Myxococcales bacterium]|jgi:dTDP-4-amino-4,6-dideoxygalactose transaminase|nr:DegT/DnrJ/EryC1/StrS family aminotransferase [Myxococcales bacterium]